MNLQLKSKIEYKNEINIDIKIKLKTQIIAFVNKSTIMQPVYTLALITKGAMVCGCCGAPNRTKSGCSCTGGKSHQCLKTSTPSLTPSLTYLVQPTSSFRPSYSTMSTTTPMSTLQSLAPMSTMQSLASIPVAQDLPKFCALKVKYK